MGRDSVTESGRGMNPDAPQRTGVPALRRYWVGGRSGFTAENAGTAEFRRKRVGLPCDGSAFFASLRFILSEGSNEENRGYRSSRPIFRQGPLSVHSTLSAVKTAGQELGNG